MPATEKSVMCRAAISMLSGVGLKTNPRRSAIGFFRTQMMVCARMPPHAAEDPGIGGVAFHQLRDHASEELQPRACRLLDQRVHRRRRVVDLALNEAVDGLVFRIEDAAQKDRQIPPQLFGRRMSFGGAASSLVRLANRVDRDLQHLAIQTLLVAEVIVHGRDVGASRPGDVADGDVLEPTRREQLLGRMEQPRARLAIAAGGAGSSAFLHSVRLKSAVAAVIATTENSRRKPRS